MHWGIDHPPEKEKPKEVEPTVNLTFGWMFNHCSNWDNLCDELGLNPWCLNEGLAEKDTPMQVKLSVAKKHGLI